MSKEILEVGLRELRLDYEILESILNKYIGHSYNLVWKHHFEIPRGVEALCLNNSCYLRKYNDSYLLKPFLYIRITIESLEPFRVKLVKRYLDEQDVQSIIREYEEMYKYEDNLREFFTYEYRLLLKSLEEYKDKLRKIGIEA